MTDTIENIGLYLKNLREERKIPIAQAAQALKTKIETIQAIEANEFEKIAAPTYVKGYLRSYANFLDIDSESILMEYNKKYPSSSKQVFILQGQQLPRVGLNLGAVLKSKIFIYGIASIIVLSIMLIFGIRSLIKKITAKTAKVKEAPAQVQKEPEKPAITPQVTGPISTPINLSAHASDNVWIRIASDNKIIFEGILRKNETESWQAQNEFKLRIGNPGKLNLSINGKPAGTISPYGPINVTINEKGLKLEK